MARRVSLSLPKYYPLSRLDLCCSTHSRTGANRVKIFKMIFILKRKLFTIQEIIYLCTKTR